MSYPLVQIWNSTQYACTGKVSYASAFCSDDDYKIDQHGTWKASNRGVCLLTKVTASLNVNGNWVEAKTYSSSGTSYSKFAIIQKGQEFVVTRITNDVTDDVEEIMEEPAEFQK